MEKKLFYLLEFKGSDHDYDCTICRDLKEVCVYLESEETGLSKIGDYLLGDDIEPSVTITGTWMTEEEYQKWMEEMKCL